MRACLIALLTYWLSGSAIGASNPPIVRLGNEGDYPNNNNRYGEEYPEADQRSSNSGPSTILEIPSPTTSPTSPCKNPNETYQPEQETERKVTDRALAGGTVALAIFTLGLCVYTARLFGATKALVESAEKTSTRQLRAYVHITRSKTAHFIDFVEGGEPTAAVNLKNFGQTPAHDVVVRVDMAVRSLDTKESFRDPAHIELGPKTVLGPGSRFTAITTKEAPLTNEEVVDLKSGRRVLFLFGIIDYRDAFDKPQHTTFRLWYGVDSTSEEQFNWCQDGNNAT